VPQETKKRVKRVSALGLLILKMDFNSLKGYFTSGKMNLYLKWVIYVEEM